MKIRILLFCLPFLFISSALAEESETKKVDISGGARFRAEFTDNKDLDNTVSDSKDFVGARIRLNLTLNPIKNLTGFIQPQFSGNWGQVDPTGLTTSGALLNRPITLHQGYAKWQALDFLAFKIGRQELSYGDYLVLGSVEYSNVGRSFDAALAELSFNSFHIDLFYSRLAEQNFAPVALIGDDHFSGIYAMLDPMGIFKAIDFYTFWLIQKDNSTSPKDKTLFNFGSFGGRVKHNWLGFDGRLETVLQAGEHSGATMVAGMFDLEEGYTFDILKGLRIAGEYSFASGNDSSTGTFTRYHQLFPTAHKWLGWLDFFGRSNIQEGVLHANLKIDNQWSASTRLHTFWKVEANDSLYDLTGKSIPGTSGTTEKHAGEELNVIVKYDPVKWISIQAMTGFLFPGKLMQNAYKGSDVSYLTYLETTFIF